MYPLPPRVWSVWSVWSVLCLTTRLIQQTLFSTAIAPHGIAIEQDSRLVDGTYLYNCKLDLVPLVESAIQE